MFTEKFEGSDKKTIEDQAAIECVVNGITYRARIEKDDDCGLPEENDDGFWPSLDPQEPGWIGDNPPRSFEEQLADCDEVMDRVKHGQMIYCGVVLSASKADVPLLSLYSTAIWGCAINWPHGDNDHLRDVANELLAEGQPIAEAKLVELIASLEA